MYAKILVPIGAVALALLLPVPTAYTGCECPCLSGTFDIYENGDVTGETVTFSGAGIISHYTSTNGCEGTIRGGLLCRSGSLPCPSIRSFSPGAGECATGQVQCNHGTWVWSDAGTGTGAGTMEPR